MNTATNPATAEERAQFEAWARRTHTRPGTHFNQSHNGVYTDNRIAAKWAAWQAARATQASAEPVDTRRCKPCASRRGGEKCWKCGSATFTPDPRCGEEPALPPIDRIRELAKEVGYAIGVHGSQQRDFDVIAAPWTDMAIGNHALLEHIAAGLTTDNGPARIVSTERKPLGRYAATIQMDGWYKQLDISVCPNEQYAAPSSAPSTEPVVQPVTVSMCASKDYALGWNECLAAVQASERAPSIDSAGEADTKRLDWLLTKCVNVRVPLRYGSRDLFWSSPVDDDGEELPSDLRDQIDAAMQPQSAGGDHG